MADAVRAALVEAGAFAIMYDQYGPGVFYKAFVDEAAVAAFDPATVLFHSESRAECCGRFAVGSVRGDPAARVVVVDLVYANQRLTYVNDEAPVTETLELRPYPVTVTDVSREADEAACAAFETRVRAVLPTLTLSDTRRCVLYGDYTNDDVDVVNDVEFEVTFPDMAPRPETVQMQRMYDEYDPQTHVMLVYRVRETAEVIWLMPRE